MLSLNLKNEHSVLDTVNRLEGAILAWKHAISDESNKKRPIRHRWYFMKDTGSELEKLVLWMERAEALVQLLKIRFPNLPQTFVDVSKVQYNKVLLNALEICVISCWSSQNHLSIRKQNKSIYTNLLIISSVDSSNSLVSPCLYKLLLKIHYKLSWPSLAASFLRPWFRLKLNETMDCMQTNHGFQILAQIKVFKTMVLVILRSLKPRFEKPYFWLPNIRPYFCSFFFE